MQFSLFGVPFKCSRDMFTWEKIRSACFISWSISWRFMILLGVIATAAYPFANYMQKDDFGMVHFIILAIFFVILFWSYYYVKHSVLFEISYRTINRRYINEHSKPEFVSWRFWKPQLVVMLIYFLILSVLLVICGLIARELIIKNLWLEVLLFVVGCLSSIGFAMITLNHIIINGGTFGFIIDVVNDEIKYVLERKPSFVERFKLSFILWFTAYGAILAVSSYFHTALNVPYYFEPYVIKVLTYTSGSMWIATAYLALMILMVLVPTIVLALYAYYDALYMFPYKLVGRMYTNLNKAPKLWSFRFLGTYLLSGLVSLGLAWVLSMLVFAIFDDYEVVDLVVYVVSFFIASAGISNLFISIGAWGFVPVRKNLYETVK